MSNFSHERACRRTRRQNAARDARDARAHYRAVASARRSARCAWCMQIPRNGICDCTHVESNAPAGSLEESFTRKTR